MLILGIETSCDETSAAVVADGREVRSNIVLSQAAEHAQYGGVVPEVASRRHLEALPDVTRQALDQCGADWYDIDSIAVTQGPGLASSLLMGVTTARALSLRLDIPLLGINHLQAHLYSVFLGSDLSMDEICPMVVLLVSGGHTMLVRVDDVRNFTVLGHTLDDAAGEALDKGATVLGLGYPGGPAIEKAAQGGNPGRIDFPRGILKGKGRGGEALIDGMRRDCCFSFSGLKTALLYHVRNHPESRAGEDLGDVAAAYQEAVFDSLLDRLENAVVHEKVRAIACVGGVARNKRLRTMLESTSERLGSRLLIAPFEYCTDNAAMIAGLAGALSLNGSAPPAPDNVYPSLRSMDYGYKA